ncbi:type II secretion system protein [Lentibacillus lipolyticus]|nr:type II secretion system protein [Lentibacillus lipolyticus]
MPNKLSAANSSTKVNPFSFLSRRNVICTHPITWYNRQKVVLEGRGSMKTGRNNLNCNGYTLIEIIASITILGMVVAVFLPILPQIMSWTSKTGDELVTSNLLGQVAYDVKHSSILSDHTGVIPNCANGTISMDYPSYLLNDKDYPIQLNVCKENDVDLYRTNIQIYAPDNKQISESYTYIKKKDDGW